jgi:hypothetical protein
MSEKTTDATEGNFPERLPETMPFGAKEFAAVRSHQDSSDSNENRRSASQAAILINGGAATAVLAFLSKDKIDPYFLRVVPVALIGYGFGVAAGAFMVYFTGQALHHWGLSWREYMVYGPTSEGMKKNDAEAKKWNKRASYAFYCAMAAFLLASVYMAIIFFRVPSPPAPWWTE